MKKIFLLMLAAVLFAACGDDDDETVNPTPTPSTKYVFETYDYSKAVGMSYTNMLSTYGEPTLAFDGFYSYDVNNGKVESVTFLINKSNNKVYNVMEILVENAFTKADIFDYFSSKYTLYDYNETGYTVDGETVKTSIATFGNKTKKEDATLVIEVSDNSSVVYSDPTNMPDEPDMADFSNVAPENVASMFLGMSEDDLMDKYSDVIITFNGVTMINVEGNNYYTCIYLNIEDGIVTMVRTLFDDFTDDEVIEYFKGVGYVATDCGVDEESGEHIYLLMNQTTMDVFTYCSSIATWVYSDPDADDDETDED